MENLKRFKTKSGTNNWSFTWSWAEAVKPDLGVVGRHYAGSGGGCDEYTDGQIVEFNRTDRPLAGRQVDLMGYPFFFCYEGYFVLEPDPVTNESINLWCGQTPSLLLHALKQSAAKVVFRQGPGTAAEVMNKLVFNRNLLSLGSGLTGGNFDLLDKILSRGPLMDSFECGNLITRKIYSRREFAFLDTFSAESWTGILISMLVISLITCLMGRNNSAKTESKKALIRTTTERPYKWPGQTEGGHGTLLQDWPGMVLEFGGLLWGEAAFNLERYHRGLVSLWLLACTVVVGCLAGNLRDMMSQAAETLVPESWDDLWRAPWHHHSLATTTFHPAWDDFNLKYGPEIVDQLDDAGRLLVVPSKKRDWPDYFSDPTKYLIEFITVLQNLSEYILLAHRRFFLSAMWGTQVGRRSVIEVLAYIYSSDGDHEDLIEAEHKLDAILEDYYHHVAISPGSATMHIYFAFVRQANNAAELYVSRFIDRFRENGMAHLQGTENDRKIESKILTHQTVAAGAEVLHLEDFFGPLILSWSFLACAVAVVCSEIYHHIRHTNRIASVQDS